MFRIPPVVLFAALLFSGKPALSQISSSDEAAGPLPTLRFFYYHSGNVEWATDAEPDRWQTHLEANALSSQLFSTLTAAASDTDDVDRVRVRMTRWIEQERAQFNGYNPDRFRKAEGIVAYLRAHDFSVKKLVAALLKRSGAAEVELVAVHLVDEEGDSSFLLKVVLLRHQTDLARQAFNVTLRDASVDYTLVIYSLGVALYELHEIINAESASEEGEDRLQIEELPVPEFTNPT